MEHNDHQESTFKLIAVPFIISLFVTLTRLTGELRHWSEIWFYRGTSGIVPTLTNWFVGITWLAIPFGIYFAYKLSKSGTIAADLNKVVILAVIGPVVMYGGFLLVARFVNVGPPAALLIIWSVSVISAAIQFFGWRPLFKTLLLYGLASRAVVALVMFLAMRGNWGTHYDYFDMPPALKTNLWSEYFWLAFFPQLIFWVGYTIVLGSLSGGITLAVISARKRKTLTAHA